MKVLIFSGEISNSRPLTYNLPREWQERTVSVADEELNAIINKYGDIRSVSAAETSRFLSRSASRFLNDVRDQTLTVVVAIGIGVHVAQALIDSRDWTGPTVFVDPEGVFRRSSPAQFDECEVDLDSDDPGPETRKTAWILRGGTAAVHASQLKKSQQFREASCAVTVTDPDFCASVYGSGLLASCIRAVTA
ncbi:MAG: hypothetical protein EBZ49_02710 [Proteobacteria bacterium]|nr:hypothetical protein [Pseudomonadota bacterium]